MWSYNFGWHTKQHCCNKRWLLLNAWEILVNALHSNELSAFQNSFYPEYKAYTQCIYYIYMHARMWQICLVFSVFAAVVLSVSLVFFFQCMVHFKGSWAKETTKSFTGSLGFWSTYAIYSTRLVRNGPKNGSVLNQDCAWRWLWT